MAEKNASSASRIIRIVALFASVVCFFEFFYGMWNNNNQGRWKDDIHLFGLGCLMLVISITGFMPNKKSEQTNIVDEKQSNTKDQRN